MAWHAGVDLSTGDIITASKWNNYWGASDAVDYLKGVFDIINSAVQADVLSSRAYDGVYQNTSGGYLMVAVIAEENGSNRDMDFAAYVENATPPTIEVARASLDNDVLSVDYATILFCVPPNYYYKVSDTGANSTVLYKWTEWTIHGTA